MDTDRRNRRPGLAWPLLLIAIGIGVLLNNLGSLPGNFWDVVSVYWPVLFIVFGLDGLYRGDGVVGSIQGVGIGIVFLMSNLGMLQLDIWDIILRFWPLLIVSAGLDVMLGRRGQRSPWGYLVGLVFFVLFLGGVFWINNNGTWLNRTMTRHEFTQEIGDAQAYRLRLHNIAGDVDIQAAEDRGTLLSGVVMTRPAENFQVERSGSGADVNVDIGTQGTVVITPFDGSLNSPKWDVSINPDIPTELSVDLIFGGLTSDLRSTQVTQLNLDTIFGNKTITLSDDVDTKGDLSGIVGTTTIYVPAGVPAKIHIGGGLMVRSIPDGYTTDGEWIYSPTARNADTYNELDVSQMIGSLIVREQ